MIIVFAREDVTETPTADRWKALAARLVGSVLKPGDASFDHVRSVWNGAFDRVPEVIVRCAGVQDVSAALRFAAEHGVTVTPRSGGHSLAGLSAPDGGMVVDLSAMNTVEVDVDARRARAQAGALGRDLDQATQQHGLGTTLGTISHTGVAGLTLGGGMGWLMRAYGLASDNVRSMQVVLADGSVLRVDADHHPQLFWALRGGGGLAVVTEFEYELHRVGPQVALAQYAFDADRAPEALATARDLARGAPRHRDLFLSHRTVSPGPDTPAALDRAGTFFVMGFSGDARDTDWLAPLGALGPIHHQVEPVDYVTVQSAFDGANPHGTRAHGKGAFVPELDDETLGIFVEHATCAPGDTMSYLQQMGGAVADRSDDGGAVQGRAADYVFNVVSRWDHRGALREASAHTRRVIQALPRTGPHPPLNFESDVAEVSQKPGQGLYPTSTTDRLRAVKDTYDPGGILRTDQL